MVCNALVGGGRRLGAGQQAMRPGRIACGTRRGEGSAAGSGRTLPPGKTRVPILQEAGWAPGPVWTGEKFRPHRDSIPDRPARSQSLYRLSYRAHLQVFRPFIIIGHS